MKNKNEMYKGVLAENYIASEFYQTFRELYYYTFKNFGFENNIKSVPLYATFCIKN